MDLQTYKTSLSRVNQTAVPVNIVKKIGLKAGDEIIWSIEPDNVTIKIIPVKKLGDFLRGLGKEVWKGVDVEKYIKDGRKDRVFE